MSDTITPREQRILLTALEWFTSNKNGGWVGHNVRRNADIHIRMEDEAEDEAIRSLRGRGLLKLKVERIDPYLFRYYRLDVRGLFLAYLRNVEVKWHE